MPPIQRDLTNLYISESYYRLMQTDPIDDITLLDGTGSLVTYLAVSGTVDAFYFKGDGSQLRNISGAALPQGIVSSSTQTIQNLAGTNIISSSAQRSVLGLATTDSPTFANLTLTGDLTARQLIISSSVIVVTQSYSSGSTIFGNTMDDFHQFTGSVYITSSLTTTGPGIFQSRNPSSEYILTLKGYNTGSKLSIGVSGDSLYGVTADVLNHNNTAYGKFSLNAQDIYFSVYSASIAHLNVFYIGGDGITRIHTLYTDNYINAPGILNTDTNGFAELAWQNGTEYFANVIARKQGVNIDTGDADHTYTWLFNNSGSLILPFSGSGSILNPDSTPWSASYAIVALDVINSGSFATTGSNTFDGSQIVNGNVFIDGTLTARTYVVSSSIVNIETMGVSGSTIFGDTANDTHQFTGSLLVNGAASSSLGFYGNLTGTSSVASLATTSSYIDPLFISASVAYYGFAGSNDVQWNNILFKPANIISSSGQRSVLGLGENDSPRFSTIYGTNANLDGNLLVGGTITARTYIISSSVVDYQTIQVSGSSKFGDSFDDVHQFTGSLQSPSITGSLQGSSSYALTASYALNAGGSSINTGSFATTGSNTFFGNQIVNGNVVITGSLTAQQYIVSSSVLYLTQSFSSGSTMFGNSLDDKHQFTGSLYVTGALVIPTVQTLSPTADVGSIVINNNNLYIYF